MKKYFIILITVFFATATNIHGQEFAQDLWHGGKVVLVSGDTLKGQIKYDLAKDLVQIEIDERIFTFGSKKAHYFEIFDVTVDNFRQFYSLPFTISPGYQAPIFFEVVYEGRLTLLCREFFTKQTSHTNSYYYNGSSYTRTVQDYEFYFLKSNGEIIYFQEKKRDLLDIMADRSNQVKEFIKSYNLKVDEKGDLARITAYYNGLIES